MNIQFIFAWGNIHKDICNFADLNKSYSYILTKCLCVCVSVCLSPSLGAEGTETGRQAPKQG